MIKKLYIYLITNSLNTKTISFKTTKIILKELTKSCKHIALTKQIRLPKMSDLELIALNITAEYMSINSELLLFFHFLFLKN